MSQFHEDWMKPRCAAPDCECYYDRAQCVLFEGDKMSPLRPLSQKPRYRIHFRVLDADYRRLVPRVQSYSHHVQIWTVGGDGRIDGCVSVGYLTLDKG